MATTKESQKGNDRSLFGTDQVLRSGRRRYLLQRVLDQQLAPLDHLWDGAKISREKSEDCIPINHSYNLLGLLLGCRLTSLWDLNHLTSRTS
jgi:hypothetical protein